MWVSGTPSHKEIFQFKVCTLLFPEYNADSWLADMYAVTCLKLSEERFQLAFSNSFTPQYLHMRETQNQT